jgi:hypothetical protein
MAARPAIRPADSARERGSLGRAMKPETGTAKQLTI